jgi:autotransporter-associated beta strand protein
MSAVLWTGAGGNTNWDDPLNWSTHKLPGPQDDVAIKISASVVHSDAASDSIRSLTSTQPLKLSAGTLSIASSSAVDGPLIINGGTLAGTGDLSVGGLLTLSSGTISGSGKVSANGGILINPAGAAFNLDGRTLINPAGKTATWTGTGGAIDASNGAVVENLGTFVAENSGTLNQGSGAASAFIDKGSFTKSSSDGVLAFNGVALSTMGGAVDVQKGMLSLQGGGTETNASFTVESGATLEFAGATPFGLDSATRFTGGGNLTKNGPTAPVLSGDSSSFGGSTTVSSGTLLVNGSLAKSTVSVLSGGTLGGTGTVGSIATKGGTVSPGTGSGILHVDGNVVLDPSAKFAVALDGPAPGTGYGQLSASGSVNLNGSTLDATLGFSPSAQTFTIIRSTAPIIGTFRGLSEGATLFIGGLLFKITYAGGKGDDVVLTHIGPVLRPEILTIDSATFAVENGGKFTVDAIGGPTPALSESGALPLGVTFKDNGDGSATLAGTPKAGTGGVYHLTITAANAQKSSATQNFTLTVNQAPAITTAAATTFDVGIASLFIVKTTGFPTATLSETGSLPRGVTFKNKGDGTALLSGTPADGKAGGYHLTLKAANGVGSAAAQSFTVNVGISTPPRVVRLERLPGRRPTRIVLTFNEPMNAALAQATSNYVFRKFIRGHTLAGPGKAIRVRSAVYDPAQQTVTLTTAKRLGLKQVYQITVNGAAPHGLANISGVPLDGQGSGAPGSNYVVFLSGRGSLT